MTIASREQLILSYCEHRPKAEAPEIGKAVGMSTTAVQSALRRMRERWPESCKGLVNPMRLGRIEFSFYFSLGSQSRPQRERIVNHLARFPQVIWLGTLAGDFQFGERSGRETAG